MADQDNRSLRIIRLAKGWLYPDEASMASLGKAPMPPASRRKKHGAKRWHT